MHHGARVALMNVDRILDLNLICCVIHSIDNFLPGSSLSVMTSCCVNYTLGISLQNALSQKTLESVSPSINMPRPCTLVLSGTPDN